MFVYRHDLFVPSAKLWLDPRRRRDFAFISHAHGDHIGRHQRILATPATARLTEHRLGSLNIETMELGEERTVGEDTTVKLHPAGHVLGAAQIELVHRGEKLVYTGDFRLKPSATTPAGQVVPCDVLVMECTFGRPHYLFPPREEVLPQLVAGIREILDAGRTPVLLAYAMGRSQELLKLLEPYDLALHLAPPIHATVRVYEELGIKFGPYQLARPGGSGGAVLMVPPHASTSRLVRQAHKPVLVAATGWAMDGKPPYRADRCYPFSDHADYGELLQYVREAAPREVYVINGFEDLCEHLRKEGVRAYPASTRVALQ